MNRLLLPIIILLSFFQLGICNPLTVVSWNIKDFGQSRNDAEIHAIANVIKHADIVAIQEVVAIDPGGAQAVARLADELNRMGSKWDYRVSERTQSPSSNISERYAYLWKTSIVTITGGGPRLLSQLSDLINREPYFIQFKVSGKTLSVLNFHACTHYKTYPERAEVQAITEWIENQDLGNLIFAGDFNLTVTDIGFNSLKSLGFTNALNEQRTSLKKECKDGIYLSRDEDNIFFKLNDFTVSSSKVLDFIHECHEVAWKRDSLSDHLGVEVVIY